jgi:hypothetical protein
VLVLGGAGEQEQLASLGLKRGDSLGQLLGIGRRHRPRGHHRPRPLLVDGQL